jgi:hypothetical protein
MEGERSNEQVMRTGLLKSKDCVGNNIWQTEIHKMKTQTNLARLTANTCKNYNFTDRSRSEILHTSFNKFRQSKYECPTGAKNCG